MSPRLYKRLDSSFGESKPSRNKWIAEGKDSLETPRKRYFNASVVFQPCRSKHLHEWCLWFLRIFMIIHFRQSESLLQNFYFRNPSSSDGSRKRDKEKDSKSSSSFLSSIIGSDDSSSASSYDSV